MASLKASAQGLAKIRQARKSQGLPIYDFYWLQAASEIMGVDWNLTGELARGISEGTWKRFLAGRQPINASAFKAYCQMLGLEWQDVQEAGQTSGATTGVVGNASWGDAPDCQGFCGRDQELQQLSHWICQDRCRLVAILGLGGMGKTALAVQLGHRLLGDFEQVIWRSLRYAPTAKELVQDWLQGLSVSPSDMATQTLDQLQRTLLEALAQRRCLLILDNGETLLDEGKTGRYRPGYEAYGQLLRSLGEINHTSCVILTSREKPSEVGALEGTHLPVRSFSLTGLSVESAITLIKAKGIIGSVPEMQSLVHHYDGNPLALKIVATSIRDLFLGQISSFLQQGVVIFNGIRRLLEDQFKRLSGLEQQIMNWLVCDRTPITVQTLQQDLFPPVSLAQLLESLESLAWRSLIEKNIIEKNIVERPKFDSDSANSDSANVGSTEVRFSLQPVVMAYGTTHLIETLSTELLSQVGPSQVGPSQQAQALHHYALLKPHAPDYIREAQIQCLLTPLLAHLHQALGSPQHIYRCLTAGLSQLHQQPAQQVGYAAGNLVNLLGQLQSDLNDLDLSYLPLWHADLRSKTLQRTNLSGTDLRQAAFTQTFSSISTLACSPDGQWLASGDTQSEIRLWDLATDTLQAVLKGHQGWVLSVAFSPDGQWLASGSEDRTIKLWSMATGQCHHTWHGHQNWVRSVAFSADGEILASASKDGTIRLWNLESKAAVAVLTGHDAAVCAIAWHPYARRLVSGSEDGTLRLWNTLNEKCLRIFQGHQNWVWSVSFSPDGQWLASGSVDCSVKVWSVQGNDCYTFTGHTSGVWSVKFHPTAAELVSSSEDSLIKRWNINTGHCIQTLVGHTLGVRAVAFTPEGLTLISGGADQQIKVWNLQTGQCDRTWQGYTRQIYTVAFSPSGQQIASGGSTPSVNLWEIASGTAHTCLAHSGWVWQLAYDPTGHKLVTGGVAGLLRLWDPHTGQLLNTLQGHQGWIWTLAFDPQGTLIASAGIEPEIRLWQVETGQCQQILSGHTSGVWAVAFHPNGQWLASGGLDATIRYWAISTGDCLLRWESPHSWVLALAFSPDGRFLASGHADGAVQVRDLKTGETKTFLEHTNQVHTVKFSPDGQWLASGGADCCVKLWDWGKVETHSDSDRGESQEAQTCWQTLEGHHKLVRAIDISPDGSTLVSASDDGHLKLWKIKSGQLLKTLTIKRPYEQMQISGIIGVTPAQKLMLKELGAV
ncbi:MAG: NB-ARC domain-containing protein [Cyanobacteria bacterium J06635_1]